MPLCSARSHFISINYHPNTELPASTMDPSLVRIILPLSVFKTTITGEPTCASSPALATTSSARPSTATTPAQAKPLASLSQSGSSGHIPYPAARVLVHLGGTLSLSPKFIHSSRHPFPLTPGRNPPLSPAVFSQPVTTFSYANSKYPTTSYYGNSKNPFTITITIYFNLSIMNI